MKKFRFLVFFALLTYKSQSQQKAINEGPIAKKVDCAQLQISFAFPQEFTSINNEELERLSNRGKKAIKEEFNNDQVLGWQTGCINMKDSLKRVIMTNRYAVKEAVSQHGSVKKFIDKTFDDTNEFMIRRIETRLGVKFSKEDVVKQSTISIAGYQVRKNALTLVKDNLSIIGRYYFFEKDGQLYLLSFTAGKAINNAEVEKAIESAVKFQ
jgi:hypothetical protein